MKKFKFGQFAVFMAVGFTLVVVGMQWYIKGQPENAGPNLSVGVVEADFRLPEYEGDLFTPQKAVYDGDELALTLQSNVLHPEPIEEVTLAKGSKRGTVIFDSISPGEFDVVVTDPPANIDNATLDLPAVSIEHLASISVDPAADTFTGPGDETYRVTHRGSSRDSGTLLFRIDYEPDDPSSPSISHAKLQAGEVEVYALGSEGKFDASNRFIFGRLVFPIEAQKLMERDGVELVITQYSEVVRDSIVMPVGLVYADDRPSTSTSLQGTP